jgi:hypothetical protein
MTAGRTSRLGFVGDKQRCVGARDNEANDKDAANIEYEDSPKGSSDGVRNISAGILSLFQLFRDSATWYCFKVAPHRQ